MGEIVRCLPTKKQNVAWLSSCCYCPDRAQNLPEPAPDSLLKMLQILSKSVHFRRSYSQTRGHRQIALKSEFIIRMKPSFEPKIIG